MKKCLIYLDKDNPKNSIDLIEVARQIYPDETVETFGISINSTCSQAMGYFDKIIRIMNNDIVDHDGKIVADIIEELHTEHGFHSILILASHFGRILAPRLAMKLNTGLTADATAINHKDGLLEMIRPAFSGKIMAAIVKKGVGPIMLSVRQNVFHVQGVLNKDTTVIDYKPKCRKTCGLKLIKTDKKEESYDIRDSKILVSGGGGIIKNFNKIESLATALKGEVAASRKIIDRGIAPRTIQVGQSGKTVTPKLYIALGINGAIQHVEGLKNVEHIISVNINKNAPICSLSDLVVQGDAVEFVDKLTNRIKQGH